MGSVETEGANSAEGVLVLLVRYRSLPPPTLAALRLCVVRAPWASLRVEMLVRKFLRLLLFMITPPLALVVAI